MLNKPASAVFPIHDLLAGRWSPRALDGNRTVEREMLVTLLEAARWAPSCYGEQPWRYMIFDRFRHAPQWQQAFELLAPGNQGWANNAPVLLISLAKKHFTHNDSPNRWAQHDVGAASENLCLQAHAMGLIAHQMGGFDADAARERLNIPEEFQPMAMIAVGYPGPIEVLDETTAEKEHAPRTRKPLEELMFEGTWGNPVST